ncbi:MAG: pantoate--beta-alanine ligase [Ferruginibacter sp.]
MILVKTIRDLQLQLTPHRQKGHRIGFVPTMGALHRGHLSLIEESRAISDITVCSIFVNPTQFNNKQDFEKYPVTITRDIDMLEGAGCDILFLPAVAEMYPANETLPHYDLGYLETVLEGEFRPGHFQGVCQIVDKLLQAVQPTTLFLGQKDYQQCMVIARMIELRQHPVQLQICTTVREQDGLAMSSRNMRLSDSERQQALYIIKTLRRIKQELRPGDMDSLKKEAAAYLEQNGFKVDYVAIADAGSLELVNDWDGKTAVVALVAAFLNEVRLIDNLVLHP